MLQVSSACDLAFLCDPPSGLSLLLYDFPHQVIRLQLTFFRSLQTNPQRNNPQAVLIRILTNYFQIIMVIKNFDLNWPEQVQSALNAVSFIFSSLDILISLDCLYLMSGAIEVPPAG